MGYLPDEGKVVLEVLLRGDLVLVTAFLLPQLELRDFGLALLVHLSPDRRALHLVVGGIAVAWRLRRGRTPDPEEGKQ